MREIIKDQNIRKKASVEKRAFGLSDILSSALTIAGVSIAGGAALGVGGGYLAARATSPSLATATTEQDLAQEALETEIDITRRQIAQLERRKKADKKALKKKVYDRFV